MILRLSLYFFCVLFFAQRIYAVDIGSDTDPDRFSAIQVANDGDRVAGFAAIDGGLKLLDSTTTATWDSFFPAAGEFGLREGTLYLNRDLLLRNVLDFQTFGNIIGNHHTIDLAAGGSLIPSKAAENCNIQFVTSISFGVSSLSSDWVVGDGSIAFAFFTGALSGIAFLLFDGVTLTLNGFILNLGGSSTQTNSVRCHPTESLCAIVRDQSTADELYIVSYNPVGPVLTTEDQDGSATGDYVACAWHPSGEFLAVGSTEVGSELRVYPFDTGTSSLGVPSILAITPTRNIQREALDWNADGTLLAVGMVHTGANPDLLIYSFDTGTGTLSFDSSTVVLTGAAVQSISWNPVETDFLAIGIEGGFTESILLYEHQTGVLSQRGDGISDLNSTQVQTVHFNPTGRCLGVGRDGFAGVGVARTYAFDNPIFEQIFSIDTTTAVASFRYSRDGLNQTTSQEGATMLQGAFESLATSNDIPSFTWSNLEFVLEQDVTIQNSTILLDGTNIINGTGSKLILDPTTALIVNPQLPTHSQRYYSWRA